MSKYKERFCHLSNHISNSFPYSVWTLAGHHDLLKLRQKLWCHAIGWLHYYSNKDIWLWGDIYGKYKKTKKLPWIRGLEVFIKIWACTLVMSKCAQYDEDEWLPESKWPLNQNVLWLIWGSYMYELIITLLGNSIMQTETLHSCKFTVVVVYMYSSVRKCQVCVTNSTISFKWSKKKKKK